MNEKKIKIDNEIEMRIVWLLPEIHVEVGKQFDDSVATQLATVLSDMRDYFMWTVLKCETREDAIQVTERYEQYVSYYEGQIDYDLICSDPVMCMHKFYCGFFFSLVELLRLKFQITQPMLTRDESGRITEISEAISYEEFEKSMEASLELLKDRINGVYP